MLVYWLIGIGIAIILGIVLFLIWWKIDTTADKWQTEIAAIARLFAKYQCDFLAEFFTALAVDDYKTAFNMMRDMLKSPNTLQIFIDKIVDPITKARQLETFDNDLKKVDR